MRTKATWAGALLLIWAGSIGLTTLASAASTVADAKRNLEAARVALAKAVARAEKDPPSPEDLSAAERAVTALHKAIEAGAPHEAQDLEYAKAALAARKELRTSREYVERRVANAHVHEQRRKIDKALAALDAALQGVKGGAPAAAAFDKARAALKALAEELDRAKPLEKDDPKLAAHVVASRTRLGRGQQELDQRQTEVQAGQNRSVLDEARKKLEAAMAPLSGKAVTDAQFDAADKAVTELEKALEAGRELESKDKSYAKLAADHRNAARNARKTIETRWSETGLQRLKAELEPPHQDLRTAARWLTGKNPSPDRLAEAKTAAIVVQKLLERSAHLAGRSAAVKAYLAEVEKTLTGVQVHLQRRQVDPARAEVLATQKKIAGSRPEERDFVDAEQAVSKTGKLLQDGEPLEKKDAGYASFAREVRRSLDEASARIVARKGELQVILQRSAIEKARADLARALLPLDKRNPDRERFDEATTAAIVFEKTLEAATGVKDRELQAYVYEMRGVLVASRRKIDERRLEVEIENQQLQVEKGRREIDLALKQIFGPKTSDDRLVAVEQAVEKTRKILDEGKALVGRDQKYAAYDREVRKRLEETLARLATRRDELAMAAQQARVTAGLKTLEKSLAAIDGPGLKAKLIAAADDALNAAGMDIEAGLELEKKLAAYRNWVRDARKTVEMAKIRLAKKKVEVSATDAKSSIEERMTALRAAVAAASQPASTPAQIEAAKKSAKAVEEALAGASALEAQDNAHQRLAAKARAELATLETSLALAASAQTFRQTVVAMLESGTAAAQDAAETKSPQLSQAEYKKAVDSLRDCQVKGEAQIEAEPRLAGFLVLAEKSPTTCKEIVAICKTRHESAADGLRKVSGVVALREGPVRAYEAARTLLTKADQTSGEDKKKILAQALTQFEECISSGKIVRYKNPELEKEEITVLGKTTTLAALIDECTEASKKMRAK